MKQITLFLFIGSLMQSPAWCMELEDVASEESLLTLHKYDIESLSRANLQTLFTHIDNGTIAPIRTFLIDRLGPLDAPFSIPISSFTLDDQKDLHQQMILLNTFRAHIEKKEGARNEWHKKACIGALLLTIGLGFIGVIGYEALSDLGFAYPGISFIPVPIGSGLSCLAIGLKTCHTEPIYIDPTIKLLINRYGQKFSAQQQAMEAYLKQGDRRLYATKKSPPKITEHEGLL